MQCDGGNLLNSFQNDCLCTDGIEGEFDSIAQECMKKNVRIGALYIYGTDITSLEPLLGALKIVETQFIVRGTRLESLELIDGLYNIGLLKTSGNDRISGIVLGKVSKVSGNLIVVANKGLYDISGLGNLTEVDGNAQIEYNGVVNKSVFDRMTYVRGSLEIHYKF